MLYDILSPLLFFASLGGIILIVGRVVIRIRREQLSTNIKSAAAQTPNALTSSWHATGGEVSQLLKPTQKSVHALRSRFALLPQMIKQTKDGVVTWRSRRREKKALRAAAPAPVTPPAASPAPVEAVELRSAATPGVITAPRRSRWRRLPSWRKARQADTAAPAPAPVPVEPVRPEFQPVVRESSAAAKGSEPTTEVPPATTTKPVAPPVVTDSPGFASSLIKRVQAQRNGRKLPDVLAGAEQELQQQHFQAAEDLLVSYIVKHPKDTNAYMLLGQAAMGREAWGEAMEIFEQVIKWNRQQVGAYTGLGLAAYRAGKFTRALQALQRAQDTQPDNREVLDCLMSIAEKMDNPALQHSISEKIEQLEANVAQKNVQENAAV